MSEKPKDKPSEVGAEKDLSGQLKIPEISHLVRSLTDTAFRYPSSQEARRTPETEKHILMVPISFAEVTSAEDEKFMIGTTSLDSCAGVAIYDEEQKIGGVSHVFFNDKESLTVYDRDAQGREIPSSGRSVIVNNPRPFEPFKWLTTSLVKKADEKGGKRYKVKVFNVGHGVRTPEQNIQLKRVVEETLASLGSEGKIVDSEYRNEQSFVLDTRDGQIRPWY